MMWRFYSIFASQGQHHMNETQLSLYFNRLGLPLMLSPNLLTLNVLQSAHIANLSFQNLSAILNEPISLDIQDIFEKVIVQQRGGYCYELNLLFAHLLQQLGFGVRLLTGKIIPHNQTENQQTRTHLLLEVNSDNKAYLVDVGFGGCAPNIPILLTSRKPHVTPQGTFCLEEYNQYLILKIQIGSERRTIYQFDLSEQFYPDLEVGNWYAATHPESPFRKHLIVSRITQNGEHHMLFNHRYNLYHPYLPHQYEELDNADDILAILHKRFHLNVNHIDANALQNFLNSKIWSQN